MNDKNLADWLRKRLNKNLAIDEWQRYSLLNLLKELTKNNI